MHPGTNTVGLARGRGHGEQNDEAQEAQQEPGAEVRIGRPLQAQTFNLAGAVKNS